MNKLHINPVIQEFTKSLEKLLELEKESQKAYSHQHQLMVDVQHEIELSVDYEEALKVSIFDDLKEISKERRRHKDTIIILDLLRKTLKRGVELEEVLRVLQSSEDWDRDYTPRAEKSLDFSSPEELKSSRLKIDRLKS